MSALSRQKMDRKQKIAGGHCVVLSLFFSGIWARRARTPPILLRRLVAVILQEASDHVPHISDQFFSLCILATRTLLSCSTRTPLSLTPWCLPSGRTPKAKAPEVWSYSSSEVCSDDPQFLGHQRSHFAQCTSTTLWPRNVTLPLVYSGGCMGT